MSSIWHKKACFFRQKILQLFQKWLSNFEWFSCQPVMFWCLLDKKYIKTRDKRYYWIIVNEICYTKGINRPDFCKIKSLYLHKRWKISWTLLNLNGSSQSGRKWTVPKANLFSKFSKLASKYMYVVLAIRKWPVKVKWSTSSIVYRPFLSFKQDRPFWENSNFELEFSLQRYKVNFCPWWLRRFAFKLYSDFVQFAAG